jgi:hypothetical protein
MSVCFTLLVLIGSYFQFLICTTTIDAFRVDAQWCAQRRGIILPRVYRSVWPFVRIGYSRPLSRKRVCPPPLNWNQMGGGGKIRLRVRGRGGANSDNWREALTLCILCGTLHTAHSQSDSYSTCLTLMILFL